MSRAENVLRRCRTIVLAATLLLSGAAAAQQEAAGAESHQRATAQRSHSGRLAMHT